MKIVEGVAWHDMHYSDGRFVRVMDNPAFKIDPNNLPIATTRTYHMDKEALQKHFPEQFVAAEVNDVYDALSITRDIMKEGWIMHAPGLYSIQSKRYFGFTKGNFMMALDMRGPKIWIHILLKDPSLMCDQIPNPENWRVTVAIKSIEEFRQIEKIINN